MLSATPIKASSGTRRGLPCQHRRHEPGGAVSNAERKFAHSVSMLKADGACLFIRGRPRGRLPGLTGIAPLRRDAAALAALFFSILPRFKLPSNVASGDL